MIERIVPGIGPVGAGQSRKVLRMADDGVIPNEFLLNHAVERRKKEIRWVSLYLPFTLFGFLMVYFLYGALFFHVPQTVFPAIVLISSLAIVFRITFYQDYLIQCDRIMLAASDLLSKRTESATIENEAEPAREPNISQHDVSALQGDRSFLHGPGQVLQDMPILQQDHPAGSKRYGLELHGLFLQAGEDLKKGKIKLFLLDQLLRYECKLPSIYDEPAVNVHVSVDISGCKAKNIISQFHTYYNRKAINLVVANSKSTHLKYLRILQEFYKRNDDPTLQQQAEDLYTFLAAIRIERKKRKMRL